MRIHHVVVLTLLLAAPARAASGEREAEEHFKRGVSLYQEADFKAALVEFRRAYEISHNFRVLFNLGQAEYQATDYAAALTSFERYLREGADKVPRARRAEVEQEITRLHTRTGVLIVTVVQVGAEVSVDDKKVGLSPLQQEVLVATGTRRVAVSKDGYKPFTTSVEIAGGDARRLDVNLGASIEPVVAPPPGPAPPAPAPEPRKTPRRIPWEGWAATGALTLGATVTGLLALKANGDLDDARAKFGVSRAELDSATSRTKAFSIVSDICFVGAVVAGSISLYLTLTPQGSSKPDKPRVGFWPGGVFAAGSF